MERKKLRDSTEVENAKDSSPQPVFNTDSFAEMMSYIPEAKDDTKGLFSGICYRMICRRNPATYYNHSTCKYYCSYCADLLNRVNPDAKKVFGHELCTLGQYHESIT